MSSPRFERYKHRPASTEPPGAVRSDGGSIYQPKYVTSTFWAESNAVFYMITLHRRVIGWLQTMLRALQKNSEHFNVVSLSGHILWKNCADFTRLRRNGSSRADLTTFIYEHSVCNGACRDRNWLTMNLPTNRLYVSMKKHYKRWLVFLRI